VPGSISIKTCMVFTVESINLFLVLWTNIILFSGLKNRLSGIYLGFQKSMVRSFKKRELAKKGTLSGHSDVFTTCPKHLNVWMGQ
jgi:hypothetical protein